MERVRIYKDRLNKPEVVAEYLGLSIRALRQLASRSASAAWEAFAGATAHGLDPDPGHEPREDDLTRCRGPLPQLSTNASANDQADHLLLAQPKRTIWAEKPAPWRW